MVPAAGACTCAGMLRYMTFPTEYPLQVTIKTNLLAELKHQAPNLISNSSDRELPRDMFRFKTVWNDLG